MTANQITRGKHACRLSAPWQQGPIRLRRATAFTRVHHSCTLPVSRPSVSLTVTVACAQKLPASKQTTGAVTTHKYFHSVTLPLTKSKHFSRRL
jgi:hypothetical protein